MAVAEKRKSAILSGRQLCANGETTSGITSYAAARAFLSGMNLEASRVTSLPRRVVSGLCVWRHRVDRAGGV